MALVFPISAFLFYGCDWLFVTVLLLDLRICTSFAKLWDYAKKTNDGRFCFFHLLNHKYRPVFISFSWSVPGSTGRVIILADFPQSSFLEYSFYSQVHSDSFL